MRMYIGSKNLGKRLEYISLLTEIDLKIDVLSLPDDIVEPEELDNSMEENATIKAMYYSGILNDYVLVEDSGLIIPSLNNYPGVVSGRFFEYKFDKDMKIIGHTPNNLNLMKSEIDTLNNNKVLQLLKGKNNRDAKLGGVTCLAKNNKIIFKSSSFVDGHISDKIIGSNGFAYDSIFVGNNFPGKTFAELDENTKTLINFRSENIRNLLDFLKNYKEEPSNVHYSTYV